MLNSVRKGMIIAFIVFTVLALASAFLAVDENVYGIKPAATDFSDGWQVDSQDIVLPYRTDDVIVATKVLPRVTFDDHLIVKARYDELKVYVDDELIYRTTPTLYLGRVTNAGSKEAFVPLKGKYSNKRVTLEIKLHKSIYGYSLNSVYISTLQNYFLLLLQRNWLILVLLILFFMSGIVEIVIAIGLKMASITSRQKYTREALLYTGLFSIDASLWAFSDTRIPGMISGNHVTWSIILYICFMLMPVCFVGLLNAMEERKNVIIKRLFWIFALVTFLAIVGVWMGYLDWQLTMIASHIMDVTDIITATVMAVIVSKRMGAAVERKLMYTGSALFVLVSSACIIIYLLNRDGNYLAYFMTALLIYIFTQVFIIIHRVGLNAQEEKDYEIAQIYAYKDDLTKLGNRRFFYNKIEELAKGELSKNTTIVYLDVNRLKYYNDNMGHDVGDELLKGAAECLINAFADGTVCRMGGDEFAVIIDATESALKDMINDFLRRAKAWRYAGIEGISAAIGYAAIRDYPDAKMSDLRRIADDQMYSDKKKYYEETGLERRELF